MLRNNEPMSDASNESSIQNNEDFADAVGDHRPRIFRFLLASSRDIETAEVLTQECFLRAYRNWSSFRGESSVATWLTRIAMNLQRDYWRNRRLQFWRETLKNSVDQDDVRDWLRADLRSPEEQLLLREQVGHVWNAVGRLTEKQRTLFLMRFVDDLPYQEIARATGLHEGTVKAHVSRALQKVRLELKRKSRVLIRSFVTGG